MDKIVLLIVFCYRYFCDCKKNVTRMTLKNMNIGNLETIILAILLRSSRG